MHHIGTFVPGEGQVFSLLPGREIGECIPEGWDYGMCTGLALLCCPQSWWLMCLPQTEE